MIDIKLSDIEIINLVTACNTAITYYDDLINSKVPFTKNVLGDFVEAKKNYEQLAKKLGESILKGDSHNVV